jgi:pimeloyl-ACP methyl ester carboxylesterase
MTAMSAITVNDVQLHYDDLGAGDQVIVWGHAFLLSAGLYLDLIDRMPGYRHIAVDFRGHGRSASVTHSCTLGQMADDVHDIVAHLGIDRFVYVGHSMGNGVGMRLAARYPDSIRAAVSMAGAPAAGLRDDSQGLGDALAAAQGDEGQLTAALGQMFIHPGNDETIKRGGQSAALVAAGPLNSITRTELLLDEADDILPSLIQPWLFLIPADDTVIPAEAQLATARAIPLARALWLNGEGHLFPQERPAETTSFIRVFLDNLSNP